MRGRLKQSTATHSRGPKQIRRERRYSEGFAAWPMARSCGASFLTGNTAVKKTVVQHRAEGQSR